MRLSPLSRVTPVFAVSAIVLIFAFTACSSGDDEDVDVGAATPVPTLVTISTPEPAAPGAGGADEAVISGESIFAAKACSACHSTGDNRVIGPGLAGVGERAATQVSGQTADEYLQESIRDPGAFVVDGFDNVMPTNFADLPESDINELIAFLKSL